MQPRGTSRRSGSVRRLMLETVALRPRQRDALRRRAEAAQQRVDGQRHDAEHRDLAQGVEAAEVHQDHVDDVAAAAVRQRVLQEEPRDAFAGAAASASRRQERPCRRPRSPRCTRSRARRSPRPASATSARRRARGASAASAGRAASAPWSRPRRCSCVSARSGAENQAKVRQVTSPAPPTMISAARRWNLRLPGGADGAGGADDPQQREGRVEWVRRMRSRSRSQSSRTAARQRRDEHGAARSAPAAAAGVREDKRVQQQRSAPRDQPDHDDVERALAVEAAE